MFAVCSQGETSAAHDVTSNIERSKHLDDEQQAKIYQAEVSTEQEISSNHVRAMIGITNDYQ
jgi:hypothetical protein